MVTIKFTLSLILACLSIGKALAFEEDGFKTGMTMQEVQALLPKGQKLDNLSLSNGNVMSFVEYEKPPKTRPTHQLPIFSFCNGLLTSYERYLKSSEDYLTMMKAMLERYGQPSKTYVDEVFFYSLKTSWIMSPERIILVFAPPLPSKGKKNKDPVYQSVIFATEHSCGVFDQPLRRSPRRIVPFGTIGMIDTDSQSARYG